MGVNDTVFYRVPNRTQVQLNSQHKQHKQRLTEIDWYRINQQYIDFHPFCNNYMLVFLYTRMCFFYIEFCVHLWINLWHDSFDSFTNIFVFFLFAFVNNRVCRFMEENAS